MEALQRIALDTNASVTQLVMELEGLDGFYFKIVCIKGNMPREEDETK